MARCWLGKVSPGWASRVETERVLREVSELCGVDTDLCCQGLGLG